MKQYIQFCKTPDGVRIAYSVLGSGPPLVKAANWMSHLEFDRDSPVWMHWLRDLSRDHTLIRYDERGCGLSDWNVEGLDLDKWVVDLETVVDALHLERFPLLGMSRGAVVAIAYAVRHPERVSRLILYGGFPLGRMARIHSAEQVEFGKVLLELVRTGWGQENPAFRQVYTTLFIPGGTPEQWNWFNDLQRISTTPEIAAKILDIDFYLDITETAKLLKVPTLVLHASGDAVVPLAQGRELATLIPEARFVTLDSRNHVLLQNEPAWGHFLSELRSFLAEDLPAVEPGEGAAGANFSDLTGRERQIVGLVAQGFNNAEIAAHLFISQHTVRNHLSHIFQKTGIDSRARMIVLARQSGSLR
jgi:pimeloyl-ACP methyl ester carboxylesterase/DNA-binding CsgD family transcriptional regulator